MTVVPGTVRSSVRVVEGVVDWFSGTPTQIPMVAGGGPAVTMTTRNDCRSADCVSAPGPRRRPRRTTRISPARLRARGQRVIRHRASRPLHKWAVAVLVKGNTRREERSRGDGGHLDLQEEDLSSAPAVIIPLGSWIATGISRPPPPGSRSGGSLVRPRTSQEVAVRYGSD